MEDWKKTLTDILQQEVTQEAMAEGNKTPEQEAVDFIEEELSKAREEGYGEGVKDGMKGKVFSKVEIKEEAHIPKELIEKIREEGRREVYEAIVFDKNIPHDVTTFVAANLWKNMRDKAKEELSKLTTK